MLHLFDHLGAGFSGIVLRYDGGQLVHVQCVLPGQLVLSALDEPKEVRSVKYTSEYRLYTF